MVCRFSSVYQHPPSLLFLAMDSQGPRCHESFGNVQYTCERVSDSRLRSHTSKTDSAATAGTLRESGNSTNLPTLRARQLSTVLVLRQHRRPSKCRADKAHSLLTLVEYSQRQIRAA